MDQGMRGSGYGCDHPRSDWRDSQHNAGSRSSFNGPWINCALRRNSDFVWPRLAFSDASSRTVNLAQTTHFDPFAVDVGVFSILVFWPAFEPCAASSVRARVFDVDLAAHPLWRDFHISFWPDAGLDHSQKSKSVFDIGRSSDYFVDDP